MVENSGAENVKRQQGQEGESFYAKEGKNFSNLL